MSADNHTKTPWKIGAMESGQVAIDGANGEEVTGWMQPEDARRIVACVNACDGLDTEKLEAQNAEGKPLWQFVQEVIAQRDHWKANHENQVRRARILMERTDMPIERVAAYNRMIELEQQREQLQREVEAWKEAIKCGCETGGIPEGTALVAVPALLAAQRDQLLARVEVAEAGYQAAVQKAEWQARTNTELNALTLKIAKLTGSKDQLLAALEELLHNSNPPYSGDAAMDADFERRYRDASERARAAIAAVKGSTA